MYARLTDHREDIAEICRRFRVAKLELFGSAVNGGFDPARSDLDFAVEFEDVPERELFDLFFGLLHALEDLFGRRVDLVDRAALRNPYLVKAIEQDGELVYAA